MLPILFYKADVIITLQNFIYAKRNNHDFYFVQTSHTMSNVMHDKSSCEQQRYGSIFILTRYKYKVITGLEVHYHFDIISLGIEFEDTRSTIQNVRDYQRMRCTAGINSAVYAPMGSKSFLCRNTHLFLVCPE